MTHISLMRVVRCVVLLLACTGASLGAQSRKGAVNVGDAVINYELTGQGKTVVFVHGWANTLAIWNNQVPRFSDRFRVLRYDRRGYGASTGFADVSADPDDLRILLDSLGIASVYVVGLSGGSEVATRFAAAFPSRIEALVRVSGPPPPGLTVTARRPQDPAERAEIARKYGLDSLGKYIYARLVWEPPGLTDAERRARDAEFWKNWALYKGQDLLDPRPQSGRVPAVAWARVHELKVPTLLVNGDHDLPLQREVADSLALRLPNVRKVVIPNGGHGPHLQQPDRFSKILIDFFSTLSR